MKHLIFGSNSPSPKRGIFKQVFFLLFMATAAVITPCDAQTETDYELEVAGVKVTSKNCSDLSVIEGVSGRVGYDPYENYLFLYDAKIESKNGVPVVLAKKDVEIFVELILQYHFPNLQHQLFQLQKLLDMLNKQFF